MVCFSCEIECGGVAVLVCVTVWVWRVWPVSSHRREACMILDAVCGNGRRAQDGENRDTQAVETSTR
jgi:hypothetical protein